MCLCVTVSVTQCLLVLACICVCKCVCVCVYYCGCYLCVWCARLFCLTVVTKAVCRRLLLFFSRMHGSFCNLYLHVIGIESVNLSDVLSVPIYVFIHIFIDI